MRKILYISGTRADYGLMLPVLRRIRDDPDLELEIVATGMHLMPEFGNTFEMIEEDGFSPVRVETIYQDDDKSSMARFAGLFTAALTAVAGEMRPDIILLVGDRAEMLAGAVVGTYLSIPVAHIHGGEITSTVDEHVRHAITKLAQIHFAATPRTAERIIRMGEDPSKVFSMGAPSLDAILGGEFTEPGEAKRSLGLSPDRPLLLVIQHPVSMEIESAGEQMEATLNVVADLGYQTVIVYPNADAGGRRMIRVIERYLRHPFIRAFRNIPRKDFLGLMMGADLLVGNSSAGIIEAASFHLPVVNIGSRQEGRERGENVLDVPVDRVAIRAAMERALTDPVFREKVSRCTNTYGDGHASERIVECLRTIPLDEQIMQKKLAY